jgi:RNA-directed DNA polymerase
MRRRRWVLLYIGRWLRAPLQRPDGTLVERDKGTPQGSAISPVLASLFMHYAFDTWMARHHPDCPFERYADDAVVHCKSGRQAKLVLAGIAARMGEVGLRLHPDKTRIVYCKDSNRPGRHEHTSFTFLGYTFRPRGVRRQDGEKFGSFSPAISAEALKATSDPLRELRIHSHTNLSLNELARWLNPIIAGWMKYYGEHRRSALYRLLRRFNAYLKPGLGRNTSGCGPTDGSNGGGPGSNNENPGYSPNGGGSAGVDRLVRRAL